jgi:predicted metal-dependent hydrolase
MTEKKWQDDELGMITIVVNPKAKRYSLKVKNGSVWGIIPVGGSEKVMKEFILKNRQRLRMVLERIAVKKDILNDTIDLPTNTFKLHIFRSERTNYYMTLKEGILHIACPQAIRFEEDRVQRILKDLLEKALRYEAKRILPQRLHTLAEQYSFSYSAVKINNSKSRWGSCSSTGSINLSLSLMILPDKLIDYVLLHELCHTKEMNHSVRFWQLMDTVTANKAKQLRGELKNYRLWQ